jgi:hypothetical protein
MMNGARNESCIIRDMVFSDIEKSGMDDSLGGGTRL